MLSKKTARIISFQQWQSTMVTWLCSVLVSTFGERRQKEHPKSTEEIVDWTGKARKWVWLIAYQVTLSEYSWVEIPSCSSWDSFIQHLTTDHSACSPHWWEILDVTNWTQKQCMHSESRGKNIFFKKEYHYRFKGPPVLIRIVLPTINTVFFLQRLGLTPSTWEAPTYMSFWLILALQRQFLKGMHIIIAFSG